MEATELLTTAPTLADPEPEPGNADTDAETDTTAPRPILTAVLTVRDIDRQGDLVEPEGLDFSNYFRNPVVLWAHDQSLPPVGRVLGLDRSADWVKGDVEFADTPFARELHGLYGAGFLRGWSLGFVARRWEPMPGAALDGEGGMRVWEAEVVEVSAVPVPANPAALTAALARTKSAELRERLKKGVAAKGIASSSNVRRIVLAGGDVERLARAVLRPAVCGSR